MHGDHLSDNDLQSYPCESLIRLDNLWTTYSDGRFGFSPQKEIWSFLGGLGSKPEGDGELERRFGDQVGWRVNDEWLRYSEYNFNPTAPPGHLPRYFCTSHSGCWLGKSCLISTRLHECSGREKIRRPEQS
jgi:hypothetical protein